MPTADFLPRGGARILVKYSPVLRLLSEISIFRSEISRLLGANRRLSNDMIADVSEQSADDLIDGVSSSK